MAEISAQLVKQLRELTGAGFNECRNALAENNGDLEKAAEHLRKKGAATAAKSPGAPLTMASSRPTPITTGAWA